MKQIKDMLDEEVIGSSHGYHITLSNGRINKLTMQLVLHVNSFNDLFLIFLSSIISVTHRSQVFFHQGEWTAIKTTHCKFILDIEDDKDSICTQLQY